MFARVFEKFNNFKGERETLIISDYAFEYIIEGVVYRTGLVDIDTYDEVIETLLDEGWEEVEEDGEF